jgi:hypothetical protein
MEASGMLHWRKPSRGYIISLGVALVGLATLGMGLGGEVRYRAGLDATDVIDHEGLWVFIFSLSWGYWFRLIFWDRVPLNYQNLVRTVLSALLIAELPLAIVAAFMAITQGKPLTDDQVAATIMIGMFTVIGVLCQISTVIWLLRYRKE